MKVNPLSIPDVLLIEPQVFGDDRGFFFESFNQKKFEEALGKKINLKRHSAIKLILCRTVTRSQLRVYYEDFIISCHQKRKAS